jgi:hypothetical protein
VHCLFRALPLFAFATCVLIESTTPAHGREYPSLEVSVYNDAQVSWDVLAKSEERASKIFSHAGVGLTWTNRGYRSGDPAPSQFTNTRDPDRVVLRIIPHPAKANNDLTFGVSFLGSDGKGRYCDVFWTRIQAFHANHNVDIAGILGSVMAHEIGHLLLGSHSHAISGIMRARWENAELHQIAMGTLLFLPWQEHEVRIRAAEFVAPFYRRSGPAR